MAKRDELLASIRRQLSVFEVEVRQNNDVNRQGINISAEDILGGLLNLLRDWNLQNANAMGQNFPAIDLADWDEGVVVQVSSDTSGTKIKETLAKLKDPRFEGKEINKLVMMFLKPKLKYTTVFEHEGFELEIMDFDDLSSAVEHKSVARLKEISAYLDEELGKLLGTAPRKPAHQLPGVPAPSASFVPGSRDKELAELKERLSPDAPIFLWGVGGIGKTEVAIQLARNFAPPEGAYFLHYYDTREEALRETILRANFTDYTYNKPDNDHRDQEYKERTDILRTEYPGALLVIDNFDCTGKTIAELMAEPAYKDLTAMGIRLVFTTRSCPEEHGYQVERLDEAFLLTLMRKNLKHINVSDDELRQLITAVDGHTLMVVLMARTLTASRGNLKAADILKALRESRMNSRSFREVSNTHNSEYLQARIYDHMKALFKLSDMNDTEQEVLRWATLLPEDGMDAGLFQSCLKDDRLNDIPENLVAQLLQAARVEFGDEAGSDEKLRQLFGEAISEMQAECDDRQDTMNSLIDRGWLALGEKNLLTIHPVIREVCWVELKPTDDNCGSFLNRLWNRYSLSKEYYADKFSQIAKCFSMASDKLADKEGAFALRAGRFWNKLGQAQTALRYNLQMVDRLEKNSNTEPNDLATAYNNVGTTYCDLGNHQKALEYQLKAMKIREKVLSPEHPHLAISYGNVGTTYGDLGNHQKALEYKLKALEIHEKVLPPTHPHLATSYNNVGTTYSELGDHRKALEYKLKDLAICEKVLPPEHPDLAISYGNVGTTYGDLGDHKNALEYKLKALAICEKVLPTEHPFLATSYNNVGSTYGELGDHRKALEYKLKDLAICEKVLPPNHPDLATSYNNIGITYANLEQFSRAAEYLEKALAIRKKTLPAGHPYIASTEENLRYTQLMAMLQEMGLSPEDFMNMMQSED